MKNKGSLQSRLRRYSIVREGSELWKVVGYREWADFVQLGKPACIWQIIGSFRRDIGSEFVQVCTGRSFRKGRSPGEWESRVWDSLETDLVNPLYCRGVPDAIEAMHGAAVAQARSWLRKYVPREVDYSKTFSVPPIPGVSRSRRTLKCATSRHTPRAIPRTRIVRTSRGSRSRLIPAMGAMMRTEDDDATEA
jgi:hypothetical protein